MLPSFATLLSILSILCVLIVPLTANYDTDGNRQQTCCGSVNHNPVKANIRAVYNTPHQTQIMGADDRYWISGVTSQTLEWPAFSADPFPDPLGLQTVNSLNQLSASAGGIGLNGRDDIFFYEFSCSDTACPKTLARYQAYVANVEPKPLLAFNSFIYDEDPFIIGLNTFEVSINAIAFNRSAYDPQRNCQILYRALNASNLGVYNDPLYSHGIQNGDHIHTSLIVADNKTASAADQAGEAWSDILKILSKSSPPASLTDIIFVHIYLRNVSDLAAVDARYATFFPVGWKPPRTVIGPTIFPLPSQQGAKVGFRIIARTPRSGNCPNPVKTFNVPEVYNHAPSPVASSASTIGRFVYVGETFGTLTAQGPASVPTNLAVQMDQIITNLEAVAVERGADRKDLFWLEGHTSLPLSNYIPLTRGIISAYNWTRAPVPAFNLLGSGNPAGLPLSFVAVFWRDDENRALDPSPYPWADFQQIFGVEADYCTSVTIANCPQPGWFFTSSPMTTRAALGAQGQGPVNKRYIGNTQMPAVRHERPLVSVSSHT